MNSANYPDYNYLIYPLCIFLLFFFYYSSLFLSTRLWNWETFRPIFIKHGIYLLHLVSYHRCILINSQLAKSYNSKCVLIDVRIKFNIYICIYGWKCDLWLYTTLIQDTIIQDRSAFLRVSSIKITMIAKNKIIVIAQAILNTLIFHYALSDYERTKRTNTSRALFVRETGRNNMAVDK